jgi:uncharacterized protein YbcI
MVESPTPRRSLQLALNELAARAFRDVTGRGATRIRAVIGQDVVTLLLEDTLTKGEQSLARLGRHEEVRVIRRAFQEEMQDRLSRGVEELTGRRVVAVLSANSVEPDYAAEVFVLGEALVEDPAV